MPSEVPRGNTSKKREQLARRERELQHALRSGFTREKLVRAAEDLRAARLSLLKAERYWAEDGRTRGRDVEERVTKIHNDTQQWMEKPVDEILRDYSVQSPDGSQRLVAASVSISTAQEVCPRQHQPKQIMLRPTFSLMAVTAMICATVFATMEMLRFRGAVGFEAHQGFPFKWYWYTDFQNNDKPNNGYLWSGLALDIIIWLFVIVVFGWCVDHLARRFRKKP
jgi:hypothetical protein